MPSPVRLPGATRRAGRSLAGCGRPPSATRPARPPPPRQGRPACLPACTTRSPARTAAAGRGAATSARRPAPAGRGAAQRLRDHAGHRGAHGRRLAPQPRQRLPGARPAPGRGPRPRRGARRRPHLPPDGGRHGPRRGAARRPRAPLARRGGRGRRGRARAHERDAPAALRGRPADQRRHARPGRRGAPRARRVPPHRLPAARRRRAGGGPGHRGLPQPGSSRRRPPAARRHPPPSRSRSAVAGTGVYAGCATTRARPSATSTSHSRPKAGTPVRDRSNSPAGTSGSTPSVRVAGSGRSPSTELQGQHRRRRGPGLRRARGRVRHGERGLGARVAGDDLRQAPAEVLRGLEQPVVQDGTPRRGSRAGRGRRRRSTCRAARRCRRGTRSGCSRRSRALMVRTPQPENISSDISARTVACDALGLGDAGPEQVPDVRGQAVDRALVGVERERVVAAVARRSRSRGRSARAGRRRRAPGGRRARRRPTPPAPRSASAQPRGVGVPLHLAHRERAARERAVAEQHRVPGVLPATAPRGRAASGGGTRGSRRRRGRPGPPSRPARGGRPARARRAKAASPVQRKVSPSSIRNRGVESTEP